MSRVLTLGQALCQVVGLTAAPELVDGVQQSEKGPGNVA